MGAGALCGLDYIVIIYLYWLLLLTLGLLPGGVGFLGHTGKQRLQHGQQARRERLSQLVARVGRDDFSQSGASPTSMVVCASISAGLLSASVQVML